jgi:GT2 family glycosyltransferase
MKLSICIINYNSNLLLAACLASIKRHPPSCDYEIIVVDNGSVDGSQRCAQDDKAVHLLQNNKNEGFAKANNQAFALSVGEYLLLLNADTEAQPVAFDELLMFADLHPQAGLVSAKLLNLDGTPQIGFNIRRLPGFAMAFCQLLLLDEVFPRNPITRNAGCWGLSYDQPQKVEQPAASALLYRRTTWEQVGGFDPIFTNWYNDCDLCKRVRDAGWGIWLCPSAHVLHYGGMGSASCQVSGVILEIYKSQRLYFLKHFGPWGYKTVSMLIIIGMFMRQIVLTISPGVARSVNMRAVQDHPDAMRSAFKKVLYDTWHTWTSLPLQFKIDLNRS